MAERDKRLAGQDARVAELTARDAAQVARLVEQEARIAALTAEVAKLTGLLGRNSSNSHLPPSSDGPGASSREGPAGKRQVNLPRAA